MSIITTHGGPSQYNKVKKSIKMGKNEVKKIFIADDILCIQKIQKNEQIIIIYKQI